MVQVNDGNPQEINIATGRRANINPRFITEADENCALCTAAAICNLGGPKMTVPHAYQLTAGDVMRELGQRHQTSGVIPNWMSVSKRTDLAQIEILPNRDYAGGGGVSLAIQQQAEGIFYYCKSKLGDCAAAIIGSVHKKYKHGEATNWMLKQYDGTLFAVYFIVAFVDKAGAHWLVAEKESGAMKYHDYQTDRPSVIGSGPTASDKPVIGILGSNYSSKDLSKMEMIVVAFQPWKQGMIVPP